MPSAAQIADNVEEHFLIEDWHSFGADYDRTLMAWWENFAAGWPRLEQKYGPRFYRMWNYYLMCCPPGPALATRPRQAGEKRRLLPGTLKPVRAGNALRPVDSIRGIP